MASYYPVRSHLRLLPAIAAGGALGSLARWGVGEALPHGVAEFAWSTFLVNVSGAFLIGILMAFTLGPWAHHVYLRPFLGVGFLGGYTTFSTYMLDTRNVLASSHPGTALLYLFGTVIAGIGAAAVSLAVTLDLLAKRAEERVAEESA